MEEKRKVKVILFDLDKTIADRDKCVLYPEARKFFYSMSLPVNRDIKIALITNQGGPACHDWFEKKIRRTLQHRSYRLAEYRKFRKFHKRPRTRFPSYEQVVERLETIRSIIEQLMGRELLVLVAWGFKTRQGKFIYPHKLRRHRNDSFRKPDVGMVKYAMDVFGVKSPTDVLIVGDSKDDENCAKKIGAHFSEANLFLGRRDYEM